MDKTLTDRDLRAMDYIIRNHPDIWGDLWRRHRSGALLPESWARYMAEAYTAADAAGPGEALPIGSQWLSTEQAARDAGVTADAIRKHAQSGRLPATQYRGQWFISLSDWERFLSDPPAPGRPRTRPAADPDAPRRPRGRPRKTPQATQDAPPAPPATEGQPQEKNTP